MYSVVREHESSKYFCGRGNSFQKFPQKFIKEFCKCIIRAYEISSNIWENVQRISHAYWENGNIFANFSKNLANNPVLFYPFGREMQFIGKVWKILKRFWQIFLHKIAKHAMVTIFFNKINKPCGRILRAFRSTSRLRSSRFPAGPSRTEYVIQHLTDHG